MAKKRINLILLFYFSHVLNLYVLTGSITPENLIFAAV
jgi:hypothetical protein